MGHLTLSNALPVRYTVERAWQIKERLTDVVFHLSQVYYIRASKRSFAMMPIPPTLLSPVTYCDCCGLPVQPQMGEICPRCSYPINPQKEISFLEENVRNLRRVEQYGGGRATVTNLIMRYQQRLNRLHQYVTQNLVGVSNQPSPLAIQQPLPSLEVALSTTEYHEYGSSASASYYTQPAQTISASPIMSPSDIPNRLPEGFDNTQTQRVPSVASAPRHGLFSFRSFLAEQTITIVSSLGAFLILIGALGFTVTTTNLFLAFLVTFLVHILFAVTGTVFNRFASFRLVARIYLAIFALLVPLVGFSAYRLVSGHLIHISSPTLVAVAATYAALVYALLAVTQQFRPFSYMSATALFTANLAIAYAFHLDIRWWPCSLMPLAFASLVALPTVAPHIFVGSTKVLREAVLVLLVACLAILGIGIFATFSYSQLSSEVRTPLFVMLLLLFAWTGAFLLLSRNFEWLPVLAYEFLACLLSFAYAFSFNMTRYALAFTGLAIFYHGITLVLRHRATPHTAFSQLSLHLDSIALVLCGFIPFLVAPFLPFSLLFRAGNISRTPLVPFHLTNLFITSLATLTIGILLTTSIAINRTRLTSVGSRFIAFASIQKQSEWRWLLLLSSFLLISLYSIIILAFNFSPFLSFVRLTLAFVFLTVALRKFHGSQWADILDVATLCISASTLILSYSQSSNTILALLLFFAALSYSIVLYQQRKTFLFLPLIFVLFALPIVWIRPTVMLSLAVLLPLLSVPVYMLMTNRIQRSTSEVRKIHWEWPLLIAGVFCGGMLSLYDAFSLVSALRLLFHLPLSVTADITVLALVWYTTAILTHARWRLLVATSFALIALLYPVNSFWTLAALAPVFVVLAISIKRLFGEIWAIPFYTIAIFAEIVTGVAAYGHNAPFTPATWILLGFAVLIYLVGVTENTILFRWTSVLFASWSLLDFVQSGDVLRPTIIAILCVAVAMAIRKYQQPQANRWVALRYSLPIYVTALIATVIVAGYGIFINPDTPFYAAAPCLFLLYALIIYSVALIERQADWLWLTAAYAIGGVLLLLNTTACALPIGVRQLGFAMCNEQVHVSVYLFWGVALVAGVLGLITNRLLTFPASSSPITPRTFVWSWPWYLTSFIAIIVAAIWSRVVVDVNGTGLLSEPLEYAMLLSFIAISIVVMLAERKPILVVLITALAVWALTRTQWSLWQVMIAFDVVFVVVFASQWMWHTLPAQQYHAAARLHALLGLCGQGCLVLFIIFNGGLFASAGLLAHVGAGSLLIFALLLAWYSQQNELTQQTRLWCMYSAGLLLSLVVSWELSALRQTHLDLLMLTPATYLVVIAPFLARDERIAYHHRIGQCCSLIGSAILLLPALWLSFNQSNLQPTLILAGESLALLLIGVGTRIRIFVLSGAGLVVISALHALFLPSLGIPSSLALTILGSVLLILATALSIARHHVQAIWTLME